MGLWDDVAGAADHLAGSTDEAVARQFDSTPGGGFADTDTIAGIGDHLAGSTDESIARQFDSTPGGGFADETARVVWDGAAGLGDWAAGDLDETVGQATSAGSVSKILGGAALVAIGVAALRGSK